VDENTRTFRLKAKLPPTYIPGTFGRIFIPVGLREAILVPRSAIINKGGLDGVIVKREREEFRVVRTGKSWIRKEDTLWPSEILGQMAGDEVLMEIISGLKAGERILLQK
ncbi:MAG: hypothetical protein ACK4WB_08895, partial [Desulfatiglandales bacterium]